MTAMPAQKTPLLLATDKGLGVEFGQPLQLGDTTVSFHPAGHVLGSAQIRVERNRWTARSVADKTDINDGAGSVASGDVWVFTGDFKRDADPTCEPFELVPCDTFITEATFALPVYKWQPGAEVAEEIFQWWQAMRRAERPAILFCYALGKAQRVLAELMPFTDKTVYLHGAVDPLTKIYRNSGVAMLPTQPVDLRDRKKSYEGELIIAPPGASGSTWMRRFPQASALIRLLIEKGIDARELVTRYDATGEETVDDASVATDTDDAGRERTGE